MGEDLHVGNITIHKREFTCMPLISQDQYIVGGPKHELTRSLVKTPHKIKGLAKISGLKAPSKTNIRHAFSNNI
jgi:hypothetical protein